MDTDTQWNHKDPKREVKAVVVLAKAYATDIIEFIKYHDNEFINEIVLKTHGAVIIEALCWLLAGAKQADPLAAYHYAMRACNYEPDLHNATDIAIIDAIGKVFTYVTDNWDDLQNRNKEI